MPVTLVTADHSPGEWRFPKVSQMDNLFEESCYKQHVQSQKLIHSSLHQNDFKASHISSSSNGFVWAVFHAYSNHHNLRLRPEDVWFAILTQLSFFINAHAEQLHHLFIAHQGRKELRVVTNDFIETVDFGWMAYQMTALIYKNVLDKELREWIMPAFTTTTNSDKVVAAILMMGTMKKYFRYTFESRCGIPAVTLLGEREDWALLVTRLEKLGHLGDEPARFAALLRPVLVHLVASFDNPKAADTLSFWGRCAHYESFGSGSSILSGWITAFCFWDEEGVLIHRTNDRYFSDQPLLRNTETDLHDVLSHQVATRDVPSCYVTVPVKVEDGPNRRIYNTVMLAGLIGIQATSSGASLAHGRNSHPSRGLSASMGNTRLDSIQPVSAWLMYEKKSSNNKKRTYSKVHSWSKLE